MKSIKEADLECASTTMMNKLIFAKKEMLDALLDGIRSETHRTNMLRIDEIDAKLEKAQGGLSKAKRPADTDGLSDATPSADAHSPAGTSPKSITRARTTQETRLMVDILVCPSFFLFIKISVCHRFSGGTQI